MARTEASLSGVVRPQIITCTRVANSDTVVVELRGDHDCSTVPALAAILASAVAFAETNLVVDMSEVRFINAACIRMLTAAGDFLVGQQRTFTLRSPSRCAKRILELCGASALIELEGK